MRKRGLQITISFLLFPLIVSFSELPPLSFNSVSTDRAALMDLYEATGGDNWSNNSGWGTGQPLADWYGIETNSEGHVTRIDLWHNNLEGQLPPSIGNLDKVKYFNVKYNHLSGPVPPEIGGMASLEWLILQGRTYGNTEKFKDPPTDPDYGYHPGKRLSNTNDFSGTIPSSIGKLSHLERFELANAPNITGPIPDEIGNLTSLVGLYLSYNNFRGTGLPAAIGKLTNLKQLYIAGANLGGEIPSTLSNLTQLTFVQMGGGDGDEYPYSNGFTGKIPNFSQATELRQITITRSNLTGNYPSYFHNGNFKHLTSIGFSRNKLTGTLPSFDGLPRLHVFRMNFNNLTGSIDHLTEVPDQMQILGIGWNNFSGDFPTGGWPDFYQLKTVYMGGNNLTGNIPCSFWNKLDNSKLGWARFDGNNFANTCPGGMNVVEGNGDLTIQL